MNRLGLTLVHRDVYLYFEVVWNLEHASAQQVLARFSNENLLEEVKCCFSFCCRANPLSIVFSFFVWFVVSTLFSNIPTSLLFCPLSLGAVKAQKKKIRDCGVS